MRVHYAVNRGALVAVLMTTAASVVLLLVGVVRGGQTSAPERPSTQRVEHVVLSSDPSPSCNWLPPQGGGELARSSCGSYSSPEQVQTIYHTSGAVTEIRQRVQFSGGATPTPTRNTSYGSSGNP